MRKKFITLTFLITFILLFASACSSKPKDDAVSKDAPADANKPADASKPADTPDASKSANPTYTIKVGHVEAEDRSTHIALVEFQKYVEEQSKGDIKVELYPNALLGGDAEMTQSVQLGTIQMTLPATSALVAFSNKFGILDMPFLFDDPKAAFAALDGDLGAELDKALDSNGFVNFGYSYNGARSITNNLKPINEPADLKGMKMRVMQSPVYISLFEALGANPTPISFGELFTALQQKTVDGQENAPSLIFAMKFFEAQKYLSLTSHTKSFLPVIMNKGYFDKLPAEYQTIVKDGARKYAVEHQRELELNSDADSIKNLESAGMVVNEITPENLQKFKDVVKPVYAEYETKLGKDLFDIAAKYATAK